MVRTALPPDSLSTTPTAATPTPVRREMVRTRERPMRRTAPSNGGRAEGRLWGGGVPGAVPNSIPNSVMGRPTDYDPSYCKLLPVLMGRGWTPTEVAVFIGVTRQTLTNWTKQNEEFLEAYKFGQDCLRSWYDMVGRAGMNSPNFKTSLYSLMRINLFPNEWVTAREERKESGKYEFEHTGKVEKTVHIDVSGLPDEKIDELMVLLAQAKTPEGKPIAAEPIRDTLH